MRRDEEQIERWKRKVHAAAFALISNGATVEEAREAFNAGVTEAGAMIQRDENRRRENEEWERRRAQRQSSYPAAGRHSVA